MTSRIGYSDQRRFEAVFYSVEHRGMVSKALHPDDCQVCAHIAAEGWTGLDGGTHCRGCCAVWGGHSTIHCVMCHRTFSTQGVLERHQSTYRDAAGELRVRCHDPATSRRRDGRARFGEPRPNGWGVPIWRRPETDSRSPSSSPHRRTTRSNERGGILGAGDG